MTPTDYRQLFAVQRKLEHVIRQICPDMDHKSGIYFLIRREENKNCAYIGKSVDLLKRMVEHLHGYSQRIDVSLKKRGFKTKENESGWELYFLHFEKSELDEKEQYFIEKYRNAGYELYNIESGGTTGKTMIGERKEGRGYREGIARGKEIVRKQIAHWFETSLDCTIKGKTNKNKEKAMQKFKDFLSGTEESVKF